MKNSIFFKYLLSLQVFLFIIGCSTDDSDISDSPYSEINFTVNAEGNYVEDFESGSKYAYAGGTVSFAGGDWYFTDALTGNLSSDNKNGSQSVRMVSNAVITMNYDLPEGAKSLSLQYSKYNKDRQSSFQVYYSTDSGSSWNSLGSEVSVKKSFLETITFPLNVKGNVRFEIRKTDGSNERLNLDDIVVEPNPVTTTGNLIDITEDYEAGSKGSYAAGTVDLPSGIWYLEDALLGSLDNDRKTGAKSVRIRDFGILEMNYDVIGAQSVNFNHAVYGTDGSSDWEFQMSTDQANTWTTIGGTQTSNSTSLQSVSFNINTSENVRFRIVKLTGSGDRINIDDFTIIGTEETGGDTGGGDPVILGEVHLTMGNPSAAITDISIPNNYLLEKEEYVMSYSRDKGTANWVSWHLDEAWLGNASRQDDFRSDSSLPASWYQVGATDYQYSGFDRGHMCPSADRTLSVDDNSNTFYMTNMMPQAPSNNRYAWANLESYCRSMLAGGNEIYIISGGYGLGGDGSNGYAEYLADGKIQIPSNTWKVIMIIPDGDDDVNRVTTSTRVIAIDMPNSNSVTSDWTQYITTVDDIEAATGYDFFDLVPDSIEDVIESNIDTL
ncbi:DNA/RNA non-specific endonuclease [Christiangramia sp. SM2212]|uniref:DNA/RNA non-specific endonuclease n=1 Tax=Christiangramia sediminicola TaxID=3073267 RepID=A0ABU1EN47_9FLAO|nr:DNA/RNA non-specific endonuclease [Christiangramia sp. SM2212]MDR5589811.1 DNA/RNA non-specific endonuclease [Christiangramia sp. SM2212]